jgi:NADP-dependent 3-hydroxy acid dehydrogenase YdfG
VPCCVCCREYTAADEASMQGLNGTSCYCLTRGLLPHMIAAGGGAVVGISSVMSLLGSMAGERWVCTWLVKPLRITLSIAGVRCYRASFGVCWCAVLASSLVMGLLRSIAGKLGL